MAATIDELKELAVLARQSGDDDLETKALESIIAMQGQTAQATTEQPQDPGFIDQAIGAADAAGTMLTGAIAEPVAGVAGIAQSLNPFAEEGAGAEAVDSVRNALTQSIKTDEGRAQLSALADKLKFISEPIKAAEKGLGEAGFEAAGPIGGAIGETLPTLATELLSLGAGRAFSGAKGAATRFKQAAPAKQAQNILDAGKDFNVRVLKSDVLPPESYGGRLLRTANEKLGPLGSGQARAAQQGERVQALTGFIDQFDIDLDSPFAANVVKSLKSKSKKTLREAGAQRSKAITALKDKGRLDTSNLDDAISSINAKQKVLGAKANQELLGDIGDIQSASQGINFDDMATLRTEVYKDLLKARRGEDIARLEPVYQSIKSAIDKDMMSFARRHDKTAAADWIRSNRKFANEFGATKQTELKRILSTGDVKPEVVVDVLKRGNVSELKRLNNAIGVNGKRNARAALIQDALEKSGWPNEINPDKFTTAISKPKAQKAIDVFFKGNDKKQVEGLRELLDATRRAQQSGAFLETGQVALPISGLGAFGVAASQSLPLTVGVTGAVAGFGKAYESAGMRNLLLRIANMPKGAKKTKLLNQESLKIIMAIEAAKQADEE